MDGEAPNKDTEMTETNTDTTTEQTAPETVTETAPTEAPASTAEQTAPVATGAVVDRSRYEYTVHKEMKTASGRASVDNNDSVASMLRGMTVEGVRIVLEANGGTWNSGWDSLNPGLARMSAGNVIRRLCKDKEVVIPDAAKATIPVIAPKPPKPPKAEKPAPAPNPEKAPKPEKPAKAEKAPKPEKAPKQSKAEMQAGLAAKMAEKSDKAA